MKVTFETATLADSVRKAAKVAPAKGQAFDKAAGLLLTVAADVTTIRATNLEVYYTEWIDTVSTEGDLVKWRLPAQLFASVVSSLPIGSGKQVTLTQVEKGQILLTSGRTKARFNLIDETYYPSWTAFDPLSLTEVADLGGRIAQVEWAASANSADVPKNGIYLDGKLAVATDGYRLAAVPLEIPTLEAPVVVPAGVLSSVLPKSGDVGLGIDGTQVLLMPDESTQIRAVTFGQKYPNVAMVMKDDYPAFITLKRNDLIEIMGRALNFTGSDRFPTMRVFIGAEEIAVMIQNQEIGLLGDVVEVPGQATHARKEFKFTPKNIMDALSSGPNDQVTLGYYPENANKIFYVDGGSGYKAWVAPRKDTGEQQGA